MVFSPHSMHIPDGFISVFIAILFWVISILVVTFALRSATHERDDHKLPIMGVLAATIFAGQMLNFAIAGGTSGHFLGATLAMILVGPWEAILVMTCVVVVQALLFQDGGLLAMGANIFNMAVIGVTISHLFLSIFNKISGERRWGLFTGAFVGAWSAIFLASLSAAFQLALSGTSPANISIPAMAGIHALIGIGEALITVGAVVFILAARPDLLFPRKGPIPANPGLLVSGTVLALFLVILSPLASIHPDGLEWVAEHQGFINLAHQPAFHLFPHYLVPGITNTALATIVSGLVGIFVITGLSLILYYLHHKNNK